MSVAPLSYVVTGNALIDGDVVWLAEGGALTRHFAQAFVFADKALAEAALAPLAKRHLEVVGCYLAEVRPTAQGYEPAHFREAFRMRGPSNYAHGKQADAASNAA